MKRLRCKYCDIARKGRTRYYYSLRSQSLTLAVQPVFADDALYVSERFPSFMVCGGCLTHAQIVLTDLLGSDTIRNGLNSDFFPLLKEFGFEDNGFTKFTLSQTEFHTRVPKR